MIIAIMMIMAGTKLRYFLTFGTAGAATGLGALFSSGSIMPEEIKISDTVTFEWEII